MTGLKLFAILYFVCATMIFVLQRRAGVPIIIPGDIYTQRGQFKVYIPISSALVLSGILFLILRRFLPG